MGWDIIFSTLIQYGIGGCVAGVLLWILSRILSNFMDKQKQDTANYMTIIEGQKVHADNHINHLDESVKDQSKEIAAQGQKLDAGFDRTVEAIKSQTELLKEVVRKG